jgi:DNA polymerase III alpha subunit
MKRDQFGLSYVTEQELCDLLYSDPGIDLTQFLVDDPLVFNSAVKSLYANMPELKTYISYDVDVEEFDRVQQAEWHMPDQYLDFDIAKWLLEQCKTDQELQRVGQELLLYQERDLFNLLRYMKYLVDTLRANNVVWGVGRGSSVSSFVLYLIGVHRINSLYYDLDPTEFLK